MSALPPGVDHLVFAAADLDAGARAVERALGVALAPGGTHARMATHNRLLRLGDTAYLEVIAIDPAAPAPGHARWFALDDPEMRATLAGGPRLVGWMARPARDVPEPPSALGRWEPFERGTLRWRLTVRDDGALPLDGVAPGLIAWDGEGHPVRRLPDAGCRLVSLALSHPRAAEVRAVLATAGLSDACELAAAPALVATIDTQRGRVVLRAGAPLP